MGPYPLKSVPASLSILRHKTRTTPPFTLKHQYAYPPWIYVNISYGTVREIFLTIKSFLKWWSFSFYSRNCFVWFSGDTVMWNKMLVTLRLKGVAFFTSVTVSIERRGMFIYILEAARCCVLAYVSVAIPAVFWAVDQRRKARKTSVYEYHWPETKTKRVRTLGSWCQGHFWCRISTATDYFGISSWCRGNWCLHFSFC